MVQYEQIRIDQKHAKLEIEKTSRIVFLTDVVIAVATSTPSNTSS